jgi:hypothetical protein
MGRILEQHGLAQRTYRRALAKAVDALRAASVGNGESGQDADERALSCAVRSNQCGQTDVELTGDPVQGWSPSAWVGEADVLQVDASELSRRVGRLGRRALPNNGQAEVLLQKGSQLVCVSDGVHQ